MKAYPTLKRWLSAGVTLLVFAATLVAIAWSNRATEEALRAREDDKAKAEASAAQPWPLFGGTVQRNMVNLTEKNVPTKWNVAKKEHIVWTADLGSKAYGGPIVADGKVFIGTNNEKPRNPRDRTPEGAPIDKGILMCFDEKTGEFLWQSVHDKLEAGLVNDWPKEGICSSPIVEGNRLYYVSNRCEVICATTEGLRAGKNEGVQDEKYKTKTDADVVWRLDMIKELGVFPHNLSVCSPLIVGDTLFVVTANGVDEGHVNIPKPEAPSFLAINKKTGKVIWKSNLPSVRYVEEIQKGNNKEDLLKDLESRGLVLMHGQWSNPVYAEPDGKPMIIFPGGNGWMYAFNPKSGELLWKFDCNPKSSRYVLGGRGTRSDFIATPVVWENKLYIAVGQDPEHDKGVGHFWCIDITKTPRNKDLDLSPVKDNFDPKAPENKDSALVWHYGGPAPAGADRDYIFGRSISTAAVHDGLVYIAELNGILHCLDAVTGKVYWEHDMGTNSWSSPYWVDGKVYMGNESGEILIFEHGKKEKLLGTMKMKGSVRATPVAANGMLFVMTENKLYAIK